MDIYKSIDVNKKVKEYQKLENISLDNCFDLKIANILKEAWSGEKPKDIAIKYSYSRQGIYDIIRRNSKVLILEEDKKYANIFRKYKWKLQEFCEAFNEKSIVYYYLKYKYATFKSAESNIVNLLSYPHIDNELKEKLSKYIYGNQK